MTKVLFRFLLTERSRAILLLQCKCNGQVPTLRVLKGKFSKRMSKIIYQRLSLIFLYIRGIYTLRKLDELSHHQGLNPKPG